MANYGIITELGIHLDDLCRNLEEWSEATFGNSSVRGPIGPVKHLKRECDEVLKKPTDCEEYADLLILVLDASRRAGIKPMQLLELAEAKVKANRLRSWPTPVKDEPCEHIRSDTLMALEKAELGARFLEEGKEKPPTLPS